MDFENYLAVSKLSNFTKKTYLYAYYKLIDCGLFERSIETTCENVIIQNIWKLTENPNTASLLNTICIIIKKETCKSYEKLIKLRERLKGEIEKHHNAKNATLNLPSYNDLVKYMENAYKEGNYTRFVINYLLLRFGVRNQDLNVLIITDKRESTKDDNFLVVLKSRIIYQRNKYKTVTKYGQKEYIVINRKFYKSVKSILDGKTSVPLLTNAKGERISEGSLGPYIQSSNTLEGIGEGNVAKILMSHFAGDYKKLRELSESRGTDAGTLINRYDITK